MKVEKGENKCVRGIGIRSERQVEEEKRGRMRHEIRREGYLLGFFPSF